MRTIIQRVCWNTRGWQLPAGSTTEKGFPAEKGFAHEEWNFQLDDAINGFVYGYTYTKPSLRTDDEKFRIYFYAIHPETKDWLLVGCYKKASLISDDEYKDLLASFQLRGIVHRRANELRRVVPHLSESAAHAEITNSVKKAWLTAKCDVESVEVYDPPLVIPKKIGKKNLSHRFARFTNLEESELDRVTTERCRKATKERSAFAEDGYFRESPTNLAEIIPRHNALSNAFCRWLESRGIMPRQEQRQVDVEYTHRSVRVLAELKVTYAAGTRHAIREAVGQLFEYNYYPGRSPADRWMIVLDKNPKSRDKEYIRSIRERFKIDLYLGWQLENGFEFDGASGIGF